MGITPGRRDENIKPLKIQAHARYTGTETVCLAQQKTGCPGRVTLGKK